MRAGAAPGSLRIVPQGDVSSAGQSSAAAVSKGEDAFCSVLLPAWHGASRARCARGIDTLILPASLLRRFDGAAVTVAAEIQPGRCGGGGIHNRHCPLGSVADTRRKLYKTSKYRTRSLQDKYRTCQACDERQVHLLEPCELRYASSQLSRACRSKSWVYIVTYNAKFFD